MGWSSSPYEEQIWDTLNYYIKNEYGVAGLMGNLFAESGLYAEIIERSNGGSAVNPYYANLVNNGTIPKNDFVDYPQGTSSYGFTYIWTKLPSGQYLKTVRIPNYGTFGKGYGLAQWTTNSRKSKMYDACFPTINDVTKQVAFLVQELQTDYKGVWNTLVNATSIKEASDKVLYDFESPPTPSSKEQERLGYSNNIYTANTGRPIPPIPPTPTTKKKMPVWMMLRRL